jgi:chromosomal replication initiator protein
LRTALGGRYETTSGLGYIRRAGSQGPLECPQTPLPKERINAAVSTQLEQIWSQVQGKLVAAVDDSTYRVWLEPLQARELTGGSLVIEVSPQAFDWVCGRFGRLLQTCTTAVLGPAVAVELVQSETTTPPQRRRLGSGPTPTAKGQTGTERRHPGDHRAPPPDPLGNPRFTFEHFVIGDSNRLAHAAALAVAELPGQAYNPLFICGPPGVGKTHLLRSIASMVLSYSPGLSVRASTGESFTSEFQLALGQGRMDSFKTRFRRVDVLLVDDVQFLERKARTEEEFFHTFNTLHEAGAQLVLTSDRPPRDLQALEDRLRERFDAGLVADIRPPDVNTRLTILRKRAQHDGIELTDPAALDVIAHRVAVNVRALEGALIRIVAFSSLTGRPFSVELATEVLDNLYPHKTPQPRSLAEIQAAACQHFDLSPEELVSPSRAARVIWPRQVAMYLARELTSESLPAIGRHFGGRDHTTVLHAWRRTTAKIHADSTSRQTVDSLREQLENTPC